MTARATLGTDDLVWYAGFGSNLSPERLVCYLAGGRPAGASRSYDGCRDPRPPRAVRTTTLTGELAFAGVSGVWGGGLAFYLPGGTGVVHARAYLITFGQFSDLVAQEARRPVGTDLELEADGHTLHGLSKVYDAIMPVGEHDGHPVLTLSATRTPEPNPPSAAYLRVIGAGLADGFGLGVDERVAYLAAARGVAPHWSADRLRALVAPDPHAEGALATRRTVE